MDQACRKFTVVVEPREEDWRGGEGDGAETSDSDADVEERVSDECIDDDAWGIERVKKVERDSRREYEPTWVQGRD